jgi:hypothetical protein
MNANPGVGFGECNALVHLAGNSKNAGMFASVLSALMSEGKRLAKSGFQDYMSALNWSGSVTIREIRLYTIRYTAEYRVTGVRRGRPPLQPFA